MYKQEFPSTIHTTIPTYPYGAQIVEIVWLFQKIVITFAPDDESQKRLVAHHRVFFDAIYSRMKN